MRRDLPKRRLLIYQRIQLLIVWVIAMLNLASGIVAAQDTSAVEHGKAIFYATGGCNCHTDEPNKGAFMAGGRAITTPFGIIYSTNITPHRKTGIGTWSDEDFLRGMTQGVGPDGTHYFPVFPYTSFTKMRHQDVLDLKAYLFSIPPIEQPNKAPKLRAPFGWRFGVRLWKWLYFRPGTWQPETGRSASWNRGAYLAQALGHCTECHTPRNFMGGLQTSMAYAGSVDGPEGELAPNITSEPETGIGDWSRTDIVWYLQTGLKPDGDDTQGLMSEVIHDGFQHLPESDLQAIADYVLALPPIRHRVEKPEKP